MDDIEQKKFAGAITKLLKRADGGLHVQGVIDALTAALKNDQTLQSDIADLAAASNAGITKTIVARHAETLLMALSKRSDDIRLKRATAVDGSKGDLSPAVRKSLE